MGHTYQYRRPRTDTEYASHKYKKRNMFSRADPEALIVDDDHLAAQLLQIVLMNFGIKTTLAFDGKDAIKHLTKKEFDLVFLDINMPGLTGADVLSQIEEMRAQSSKQEGSLPIITYSAYDQEELKIPNENGFHIVGHWQKPISLSELTVLAGKTISQLHLAVTAAMGKIK